MIELEDFEACYELGWTDGLPVIPPTLERVERMLGELSHRRDEVIAVLPPAGGMATLEKIAANAVMAGCRPEYLPVVEAAVRAVADKGFWLDDMVTAVDPMAALVLVSGPIARALKMNGDAGALGSGSRPNATIGRALNLCLRNLAGARPIRHSDERALDGSTIGHPGKYSYCYTENVVLSPWPELPTERGFDADDSTVTLYAADVPVCVVDMGRTEPELILRTIAESAAIPGTTNIFFRQDLWLVMAPEHANLIADAGWTKADAQQFLFEHASISRERLTNRGLFGFMDNVMKPSWQDDKDSDNPISIVDAPERVLITVAGAPYGGYTALCFGFGEIVINKIDTNRGS
ncbi:MAG: hypothetical protein OXG37_03055 [Actinomycetia bacterium]|nr:hypothetical protein [Actinomycetes bacterium]